MSRARFHHQQEIWNSSECRGWLIVDWDTYDAAGRWLILLNSGRYADTLSLDPRLDPGTDFEGSVSELIWLWRVCASSVGGDVNTEPERLLRLLSPGGDAKLDVE